MKFEFKGKAYTLPSHLSEITLGQRVEFYRIHGKEIESLSKKVEDIEDGFEKEGELWMLELELAMREFSHYTGIPIDQVKEEIDFESMWAIYTTDMALLRKQEAEIELQDSYEWNGDTWVIESPEIEADAKMSLNEFLHAKEIVRQMSKLGNGKWESLPYLCAIYLRKEGEPFTEQLVKDGSERLQLMQELPLDIALAVGFFLSGTLSIYRSTLVSSVKETEKGLTQPNTSTPGDG